MKLEKAASQLEALWGNRSAQTKCINEYLDRHGRPRIYLRRLGRPQVALPPPLYSREFWTDYNAAMDDNPVKASWLKSGSVAAAVLEKKAEHECPARYEGSTFRGERGERNGRKHPPQFKCRLCPATPQ